MSINQVDSGYEPEIFKSAFKEWQNYEHNNANVDLEDSEEDLGTDVTPGDASNPRRMTAINNDFANLIPETIWYV